MREKLREVLRMESGGLLVSHPRAMGSTSLTTVNEERAKAGLGSIDDVKAVHNKRVYDGEKSGQLISLRIRAEKLMKYVDRNLDYRVKAKLSDLDSSALRELFTLCAAHQRDNALTQKDIDDFIVAERSDSSPDSTFLEGLAEIK